MYRRRDSVRPCSDRSHLRSLCHQRRTPYRPMVLRKGFPNRIRGIARVSDIARWLRRSTFTPARRRCAVVAPEGAAMLYGTPRKRPTAIVVIACLIGLGPAGCETVPRQTVVRETVVERVPATSMPVGANSTTVIRQYDVAAVPPPPPVVEVVPPPPTPVAVWVGGFWRPVPHWVWVRGRWR
jgi:hypothetical protein